MMVRTGCNFIPEEDMNDVEGLSPAELDTIVRQLCEPSVPLSTEERREVVIQYLADGGSLALLRM